MDTQEFIISTDKSLLDIDMIDNFLSNESYWAQGRTKEKTKQAIDNSICFGVYHNGKQIGFARVITDYAVFAYIGDVFILKEYRGHRFIKKLMKEILAHPDLQTLRRWLLATRDAHGLYEQFGFDKLKFPERWMELPAKDAYR